MDPIGILVTVVALLVTLIVALIMHVSIILPKIQVAVENPKLAAPDATHCPMLLGNPWFQALRRVSDFWEKLAVQRAHKFLISYTIARGHIEDGDTIILDSGTTIAELPQYLNEKKPRVTVYTNNLLAAIQVVPPAEGFDCRVLAGRIDPLYGATYDSPAIAAVLAGIRASKIILAATRLSVEDGPMVRASDVNNTVFKNELVRKALLDPGDPVLMVAVDWTKLKRPLSLEGGDEYNAVLPQADWNSVMNTHRFLLVTTLPPVADDTAAAATARDVLDKFRRKADAGGMRLVICE